MPNPLTEEEITSIELPDGWTYLGYDDERWVNNKGHLQRVIWYRLRCPRGHKIRRVRCNVKIKANACYKCSNKPGPRKWKVHKRKEPNYLKPPPTWRHPTFTFIRQSRNEKNLWVQTYECPRGHSITKPIWNWKDVRACPTCKQEDLFLNDDYGHRRAIQWRYADRHSHPEILLRCDECGREEWRGRAWMKKRKTPCRCQKKRKPRLSDEEIKQGPFQKGWTYVSHTREMGLILLTLRCPNGHEVEQFRSPHMYGQICSTCKKKTL